MKLLMRVASCKISSNRITGVPGVGKAPSLKRLETFNWIREKKYVLAVDPSSTISHGSILGDKTRMEELVKDKNNTSDLLLLETP
jgi:putative protein kinase ArgK-like GTPase of G3E family